MDWYACAFLRHRQSIEADFNGNVLSEQPRMLLAPCPHTRQHRYLLSVRCVRPNQIFAMILYQTTFLVLRHEILSTICILWLFSYIVFSFSSQQIYIFFVNPQTVIAILFHLYWFIRQRLVYLRMEECFSDSVDRMYYCICFIFWKFCYNIQNILNERFMSVLHQ